MNTFFGAKRLIFGINSDGSEGESDNKDSEDSDVPLDASKAARAARASARAARKSGENGGSQPSGHPGGNNSQPSDESGLVQGTQPSESSGEELGSKEPVGPIPRVRTRRPAQLGLPSRARMVRRTGHRNRVPVTSRPMRLRMERMSLGLRVMSREREVPLWGYQSRRRDLRRAWELRRRTTARVKT